MITIKADLSNKLRNVKLYTLADLHIGDHNCDMLQISEMIEEIKNDPEAYCIINGDICNNATKTSISDIYSEKLTPMGQVQQAVAILTPIRDKILAVTSGNHEERTYKKEGIDLGELIAIELGLGSKFAPNGCTVFLRFGKQSGDKHYRPVCYVIYVTHGAGGGRKEGAKAIRLADMAAIVDADIYIHSHTHLPMTMRKGFYRTCRSNSSVEFVDRLFVNTAATLNYGGYGQKKEYTPASKKTPLIVLNGKSRDMKAIL